MCTSTYDAALRLIQQAQSRQILHLTLSPHYVQNDNPLPAPLEEVPKELAQVRHIRFLNMGFNDLNDLPDVIFRLRELEYLGLHNNTLSEIPAEIKYLRSLVTLDLRNNNLDDLPTGLGWLPHLQTIRVSGNPLKKIPNPVVLGGDDEILRWLQWRARRNGKS